MDELDRVIDDIDHDTVSGSTELADQLIITLIKLESQLTPNEKHTIKKKIERLSVKKPFFAVLRHLAETLKKSDANWSILLKEYKGRIDRTNLKISEQLISLIDPHSKVFLLHSHSKTIVSVFGIIAENNIEVKILQTVSEPEKEGTIQAERLQSLGLKVQLVDDDPEWSTLEGVDYFITGADLILPSHVANKSGTRRIAEKINRLGKPYFVLADQRKFATVPVTKLPPLFELIPRTLITKLITGE